MSRMIGSPSHNLWQVLGAFGDISSWASNVDHSCMLTEGPIGVGSSRRIQAGRITLVETITRWDPGHGLAYTIEGLPTMRLVKNEWQLATVDGGTMVTLITQIEPGPKPAHKLVAKVLGRKMAGASKQMLTGLEERAS
jgi:Polyketide cyclase / dehydrase and lipid transport